MEISPQFGSYSGVEIIVNEDTTIFAGDRSGRILTFPCEWGTQEQANNILSSLRGFQYQPYTATDALVTPAAEIGDGITLNGVYSGIYKVSRDYGPLMAADIEAPQDEEDDHEYPYEAKQDRVYKREIGEAKAQISVHSDAITSLVSRANATEESVTTLEQTSTTLSATAMRKSGGSSSSFGWNLTDSDWTLTANNATVLKATSSGVEITGKITATSGFIGNGANGFTITASSIYNGMSSLNNTSNNGIYIGTDGISLGKGAFKVTSSGSVSANNMTLSGTLTIAGTAITAAALRSGAQSAYNNGSYWSGGAGGGYAFSNATVQGTSNYPGHFRCGSLLANNIGTVGSAIVCSGVSISDSTYTPKSKYVVTGVSANVTNAYMYLTATGTTRYLLPYVSSVSYSGTTIYYLGR